MLLLATLTLTTIAARDIIERGVHEETVPRLREVPSEDRAEGQADADNLWPSLPETMPEMWPRFQDREGGIDEHLLTQVEPVQLSTVGGLGVGVVPELPGGFNLAEGGLDAILSVSAVRSDVVASGDTVRGLQTEGEALGALVTPVPTPAEVRTLPQTTIPSRRQEGNATQNDAAGEAISVLRATFYGLEDGYGVDCERRPDGTYPPRCVTASGAVFDFNGLTAATNLFALGAQLRVCVASDGDSRCVAVTVNDRCGACSLDLSRGAFSMLAPLSRGVITVEVREIQ